MSRLNDMLRATFGMSAPTPSDSPNLTSETTPMATPNPMPSIEVPAHVYATIQNFASLMGMPEDELIAALMERMGMTLGITMDAVSRARVAKRDVCVAKKQHEQSEARLTEVQEHARSASAEAHHWVNELLAEGNPYSESI